MDYILSEKDGNLEVVINNDKGHRISTFRGRTKQELIDQLIKSQMHANRELARRPKPPQADRSGK